MATTLQEIVDNARRGIAPPPRAWSIQTGQCSAARTPPRAVRPSRWRDQEAARSNRRAPGFSSGDVSVLRARGCWPSSARTPWPPRRQHSRGRAHLQLLTAHEWWPSHRAARTIPGSKESSTSTLKMILEYDSQRRHSGCGSQAAAETRRTVMSRRTCRGLFACSVKSMASDTRSLEAKRRLDWLLPSASAC